MSDQPIQTLLDKLGIDRRSPLLVHSSFRPFRQFGHTPDRFVHGLIDAMAGGTLLLPTMSWRYVTPAAPVFDIKTTPSNTGVLTEIFRTEYAARRSLHPTHSVAGLGADLDYLLKDHDLDDSPCAANSPYDRLTKADGWVLMLGITMDCCTLLHYCEETVAPDIYLKARDEMVTYSCINEAGDAKPLTFRPHKRLHRNYFRFQDALAAAGKLSVAQFDSVICRAFKAADLVEIASTALQQDPGALIARPGQRYREM